MKVRNASLLAAFTLPCVLGCDRIGHLLGDEGVWLGERVQAEAAKLRARPDSELVFAYAPESGADQNYSVGVGASVWCPHPACLHDQSSLVVTADRGNQGGTTVHKLSVAVPKSLRLYKHDDSTHVILRKKGDTIQLVGLR